MFERLQREKGGKGRQEWQQCGATGEFEIGTALGVIQGYGRTNPIRIRITGQNTDLAQLGKENELLN